jgi:RNA polymerase sigma factor (sigma-70 family)
LPQTEKELVERAAQCSSEAFTALVERYRPLMRAVTRRCLDEPGDREDVCQDVVHGLLDRKKKALRDWRPIAPFGSYLSVITSRRAVRAATKRDRLVGGVLAGLPAHHDDVPPGWLGRAAEADQPVTDHRLRTTELRLTVQEALAGLSVRDRLLLRLRVLEGLDVSSVASMMGLTMGATRKAVFDAVRRLERALEAMEFFEPQTSPPEN